MQAVLAWSSLPGVGERSLLALLDHARESRRSLAELWTAPLADLELLKLEKRAITALQDGAAARWKAAGAQAEAVRSRGVDLLVSGDPEYPEALAAGRRRAMIFAYGALGLLEEPCVAIVSSRGVSNSGLAVTDALADALARRDVPLVTSTNRESYQAAAVAAKRHAGASIMVLDRGIAETFPDSMEREPVAAARVWDAAFDPDLQLLLSPFGWKERWNPRSGPGRDALIFDLAQVIVAVEVQPGGNIARECRSAVEAGNPVLALDRGDDTPTGTRELWECGAVRVEWKGAETTAERITAALPVTARDEAVDRAADGWEREVGQFLGRACAAVSGGKRAGSAGAFPAGGHLARAARAWSRSGQDSSAGFDWLLANLTRGSQSASRPAQLLERVARGGLLAAVVPAAWLEGADFASERGAWTRTAVLRAAVALPRDVSSNGAAPLAAVILERDARTSSAAPVFRPERDRMGRFHLRRYLQEVLAKLGES